MSAYEDLTRTCAELRRQYDSARASLQYEIDSRPDNWWSGPKHWVGVKPTPDEMKDSTGRYVLLDALMTLAQAEVALLNAAQ